MDASNYIRTLAALVVVLGLIMLVLWALRRFGLGGMVPRVGPTRRRLAVVESLALDGRRRLVLVRRDDREHLLLLGNTVDVVVEQGIAAEPAPIREENA